MESLSRRTFVKGALASVPLLAQAGGTGDGRTDENPGEFVLQRPSPLDPSRKVSILGFGGVRLPVKSGKLGSQKDPVDYETASRYVDYALAHGINWFDSGYHYHNGDSERFFGHALARHPRESFWFCTKAPPWDITTLADAKRIFQEQLDRARMQYFDVYMLHSIARSEDVKRIFVDTGALDYYREEKAKGRIRHLGFSFHGRLDALDRILGYGPWDAVTILMNGIDWDGANRSRELLDRLAAKGIPAIGMESLAGGRLARLRPDAHARLAKERTDLSDAAWSLRFAAHPANLATAMTGFTRFAHLKEDISIFNAKTYRPMTASEHAAYAEAIRIEVGNGEGVPCSGCKYCVPCKYGVDIPQIFHFWNSTIKWSRLPSPTDPPDHEARIRFLDKYYELDPLRTADRCIGCGRCLKRCPQWQFKIPEELAKIDAYVESLLLAEVGYRRKRR